MHIAYSLILHSKCSANWNKTRASLLLNNLQIQHRAQLASPYCLRNRTRDFGRIRSKNFSIRIPSINDRPPPDFQTFRRPWYIPGRWKVKVLWWQYIVYFSFYSFYNWTVKVAKSGNPPLLFKETPIWGFRSSAFNN